jgi:hypothetical protein
VEGWDNRQGTPREAYDVPAELRVPGGGAAASAFGVYAFWSYCHAAGDGEAAREHWPAVRTRVAPLLEGEYPFDIRKGDSARDEAQRLNGDLAGLIGAARLARWNGDGKTGAAALAAGRRLLELRVNLERVNPRIAERTSSTTKRLHVLKLARYCDLVPEIGEALRTRTDGLGALRLKMYREARNGWHLAFGDRLIGGENYTSPPHFAHALFAGAALVEGVDGESLLSWVDVPWCRGDFYFIEKSAHALWAASGRSWTRLPASRSQ